jgi:predicted dehydrogenase
MNKKKIKFGVVGVGYLGKHHVKHLAKFDFVDLVGIYDTNKNLMTEIANMYNVPLVKSLNELLNQAEAISVVTPTEDHFKIANEALNNNCHIFIEKPISNAIESAKKILKKGVEKNKVAHVGHIERFNPAFKSFMKQNRIPLFLECHRLTKINNRSMDISVVLDLMIHDIDLVIQMIRSPIKEIIADGISIISNNIDLANVKLIFENGTVANLTASRISNKDMRKIRVFEKQKYTSIDLLNKELIEHSTDIDKNQKIIFNHQNIKIDNYDALASELSHFYDCIVKNDTDMKNMSDAIKALQIAQQINDIIQSKKVEK